MEEVLIECVPNFSEGRDPACIEGLVSAIRSTPGVLLLDSTSDWDHHRTVVTFAGPPRAVVQAAVRAASQAVASIDLRSHRGVHPRVGALDVLPFVPLGAATLAQCAELAHEAGERISQEVGVPVYFYAAAAHRSERVPLENVRRGQFEGLLMEAEKNPARAPDLGGPHLHPTAGAVIVGARKILIAFNINLATTDLALAKRIASEIRTSGGGFPAVKALGLPLRSRNLVQVSMNLTDFELTALHTVFDAVRQLAAKEGVEIAGSELIGLLPRQALLAGFAHWTKLPAFGPHSVIEEQIRKSAFDTVRLPSAFLAEERSC